MKKILSIILAVLVIVSLGGCSQGNDKKKSEASKSIEVEDINGDKIVLKKPAEKIFLGFYIENYFAISGDFKLDRIVAMSKGETKDLMNAMWSKYAKVAPNLENCIDTGSIYLDSFSMEKLIEAKPDLVILAPYQAKKLGDGIKTIKNLGIPVAVVDYNSFTLDKHIKSTEILGKLLGKEERAKELIENYKKQIKDVEDRVKEIPESKFKSVYFELASQGPETYGNSYGSSLWGNILKTARCNNIAKEKIKEYGPLNPEYVISTNPEVIIFSGQTNSKDEGKKRFEMGFDVKKERSLETMNMYLKRPGWDNLNAVKNKEVYGVDHSGLRTLYDYVYLQYIAKAIHPEKFKDVDPLANLNEFYKKYLPVKPEGTFMIKGE
ncbi:ABC transporter substrate-binding protein [Hathewaya histolytica]|uniref:ABC transporter substrate-binding protein n=1 Tax=Hathewaya histolytica TaxID=1498 RepID=UPI003B66E401